METLAYGRYVWQRVHKLHTRVLYGLILNSALISNVFIQTMTVLLGGNSQQCHLRVYIAELSWTMQARFLSNETKEDTLQKSLWKHPATNGCPFYRISPKKAPKNIHKYQVLCSSCSAPPMCSSWTALFATVETHSWNHNWNNTFNLWPRS